MLREPHGDAYAIPMPIQIGLEQAWRGLAEISLTLEDLRRALQILVGPPVMPNPSAAARGPSEDRDAWLRAYA